MLPVIGKKGMETVWWVLLVLVIMIVSLLIFFVFIRSGLIKLNTPLGGIFGSLQSIGNST